MLILILLIIIIISVIYLFQKIEMFNETGMLPSTLFGMAKHARLNKFGRVESINIHAPRLKTGETKCNKVLCPSWVPSNTICYKCY